MRFGFNLVVVVEAASQDENCDFIGFVNKPVSVVNMARIVHASGVKRTSLMLQGVFASWLYRPLAVRQIASMRVRWPG